MLFKRKNKLENKGRLTHIIINGKDISENIVEYKITQVGGERPKITIVCMPKSLDLLLDKLDNIKIKVEK